MKFAHFFNINNSEGGVFRNLAPGITATIFPGNQAMISIVNFTPNACGTMHHHPEEQWGYCVSGSGIRYQGNDAIPVSSGDLWLTPSNLPHTMEAGQNGMIVIDIFAPPRKAYTKPGAGFGLRK